MARRRCQGRDPRRAGHAKRDKHAAGKLMCKPFKKQGIAPSERVTDKCPADGAALRDLNLHRARHVQGKRMNNRAESSHVPVWRREQGVGFYVGLLGTAIRVDACIGVQRAQCLPSPDERSHVQALATGGVCGLAGGGGCSRVRPADAILIAAAVNAVTKPFTAQASTVLPATLARARPASTDGIASVLVPKDSTFQPGSDSRSCAHLS